MLIVKFFRILKAIIFFGYRFQLLKHNGVDILEYPEKKWFLVPFPSQKGIPFNNDNLATVNKSGFAEFPNFKLSLEEAEYRWKNHSDQIVRDISWRLHITLWAMSLGLKDSDSENHIFVECGTGKGYMAAGILKYFNWNKLMPTLYLIDSFKSSMPDFNGVQKDHGRELFVYANGDKEVRDYFSKYSKVEVLTGIVPEILEDLPKKKMIKFLHLDLNSHLAEEQALERLRHFFIEGSIILFDDYGGPGGEHQSIVHETFSIKYNKSLLVLPTGQALIVW